MPHPNFPYTIPSTTGRFPPLPRLIPSEKKAKYFLERQLGASRKKAADIAGISLGSARGLDARTTGTATKTYRHDVIEKPIPYHALKKEAKRAYNDIALFAERYYGMILLPFHLEDTERITELYSTPEKEYVVINMVPGSGKTEFYTRILPAWLTIRDRTIKGMLGSASHKLATRFTRVLRTDFTRQFPLRRSADDIAQGWCTDAVSTLQRDYGRFRPEAYEDDVVWRQDSFIVAQHHDISLADKEHTWAAFGRDSEEIGTRVKVAVWDDLYSEKRLKTPEAKEDMYRWWTTVAEERLEPGGLLLLVGQRLSPDDIYHYALQKQRMDDDGNLTRKYHHIIHKAHYDDLCKGVETHHHDADPWPKGCLLYPRRIKWREISEKKVNEPELYAYVFQQEDYAPSDVLVQRIWVEGGVDKETGEEFIGCWDDDRDICELPRGLSPPLYSFATADPSPSKFWSVQWWIYHPASQSRFLMDLHRGRMDAPDLLDWDHANSRYVGLMDEWQARSLKLRYPISHWIIEVNAAQKFLLQYDHVRRWRSLQRVMVIPHTTGVMKSDHELGVPSLREHWKHGRVRLPGSTHYARSKVKPLVDEVLRYNPTIQRQVGTDDCVMAQWFFEWNLPRLTARGILVPRQKRPSWAKQYARV